MGESARSERAPRSAASTGIRDGALVVLGYIPFAIAAGAAMSQTDVPRSWSIASSFVLYAGASQLGAVQLMDAGSGVALIVATVLIINARHLLYSASLAPHLAEWTRGQRMGAAFLLADPIYALVARRYAEPGRDRTRADQVGYYFGAGFTCYVGWGVLVAVGVLLGGLVPDEVPLELAVPLTFLLLLVPLIRDRAGLVTAAVGGVVALLAHPLPFGLGLLVGACAGLAAGAFVLSRTPEKDPAS